MSWLKKISDQRPLPLAPQRLAEDPVRAPKAKGVDPAEFAGAAVSEKVLQKYGANLKPAKADMNAIGQLAVTMRPHRALQFGHALDRFYGELGKFIDKMPDAEKAGATKLGVAALKGLVERVGASERIVASVETLSSLLFHGGPEAAPFPARAKTAQAEMNVLLDALEGRSGAGTLLLGFRNLTEAAVMQQKKTSFEARVGLWQAARDFLLGASPANGVTQAELGTLVGLYFSAAEKQKDPVKALAAAKKAALEPHAAGIAAARQQLEVGPQVAQGAPGHEAAKAVSAALSDLLAAHPAGPDALLGAVEQLAGAVFGRAPGMGAEEAAAHKHIAKVVRLVAGTAAAEPVLRFLAASPDLAKKPAAVAALATIKQPEQVAPGLLEAASAAKGRDTKALEDGLALLGRLPPPLAQGAALAVLPHLGQPHDGALVLATAQFARTADTLDPITRFASSYAVVHPQIAAHVGEQQTLGLAAALAAELDGQQDQRRAQFVGSAAAQVLALLPGVPLAKLATADRAGEAGILALVQKNAQGRQPLQYVSRLLQTLAAVRLPDDVKVVMARRALHVGSEVARLDRDPETVMPRILEDWAAALASPEQLQFALKGGKPIGVLARGQPSALGFLEAHAELPPELALTAGRHLSAEQLGWLVETIKNQRSHGKLRQLRDLVFGLVQQGRLDVLDAMRNSQSGGKALDAVLGHLVQEYRVGRLANVPLDQIKAGLEAGQDPMAEISAAQNAAALGAILPAGGPGLAKLDPEGVAALKRNEATLKSFLAFFPDGQKIWNLPTEVYKKPILDFLRGVAEGTLREYKYNHPVAAKQLEKLSPQAKELWSTEGVTAKAQAAAADGPELAEALPLLKGLPQMLAKVKLGTAEMPELAFDAASSAKLAGARDELVAQLRQVPKGSPEHRKASGALGPIVDRLALIELKLALDQALAQGNASASSVLLEVKAHLPSAARAVRRFGGAGIAEALMDLSERAGRIKTQPRQGLYAADEDRLDAYLTSFGAGSCIDPANGFNRPTIVEKMASGRYKMCRAMDGERPLARAFLRLLEIEVGNYKGPALWLDAPQATPNGNAGGEASMLMYRHAMTKAHAMGVPFFCTGGHVNQIAQEKGLPVQNLNVTVHLDKGVTGTHHTQYLGPIAPYGVGFGETDWNYGNQRAKDVHTMAGNVQVVMPPGMNL